MKLIVGLGNPGRAFARNRHNVGFACLKYLAQGQGIRFARKQCLARIGIGGIAGHQVVLARPQTYMNLSGRSVSRLAKKFNISLDDLIVIYDDLDLPLGKMRLRQGGGSGGQKGVDSIINELDSRDFIRVRVGISRPMETGQVDVVDHVLGDFTTEERQIISPVIARVSEAILYLLAEGLAAAMNKYNQSFAKPQTQ